MLLVTDIHGRLRNVRKLVERLRSEHIDVILIAGDLTHFGTKDQAIEILAILTELAPVLYVPGNCDTVTILDLSGDKYRSVHGKLVDIGDYCVAGFGGSCPTPFFTPLEYPDDIIESELRKLLSTVQKPVILLTHAPPYGTNLDYTVSGVHAGSRGIRKIIEEFRPVLHVCGHIHEGRGTVRIGEVLSVNPGPLQRGYYAVAELRNLDVIYLELRQL